MSCHKLQITHTTMLLIAILTFSIHLTSPNLVSSQNFSFSSFDSSSCANGSNLICWGSVSSDNGSLNISPELPNGTSKIGGVLFRHPIVIWPASFSTTFTIRTTSNSTVSDDGMAFVVARDNTPSPPGSFGSYIGIMDKASGDAGGDIRQLAVELDTHKNPRDIDDNHIAIDRSSIEYPISVKSLNDIGIDLKSGRVIIVKIEYNGWEKTLNIYVAYPGEHMLNLLNQKLIMQETVPQQAYVGFTVSTGHFSEVYQILDWSFTLYELPKESLDYGVSENKCRKVLQILMPTFVVISVAVVVILVTLRRKARLERRGDIETLTKNAANAPKLFAYKQLSRATRNFSKENLIGAGGFGSVYKGVVSNSESCVTIAVKKINASSSQGEKEYLAEICTIGRLRHKNLVQLHGWCHEKKQLLLVYEYMPNGSLDKYIGNDVLDWKTRYKILSGLASVLLYLHEECDNPIVHRDVKPNNVMLDSNYSPHLGDFGLARLLENNAFVTTMVAGTIGYLAPEVSYTERASPESDVYSFGMVVLEVVCGIRSKDVMEEFSLVDCVWNLHEKGSLLSCVDKRLGGKFDEEQVKRSLIVGLACLHPDQMLRPKMRKVVQVFMNGEEMLMKLPQTRPTELCLSLISSSPSNTIIDFGSSGTAAMEDFPVGTTKK